MNYAKVFTTRLLVIVLLLFIAGFQTFAQNKIVKGRVTASGNVPLPGVSVQLKGASAGTNTDVDGNYSISVPAAGGTLVFSSVGFATREMAIGTQTTINMELVSGSEQLTDVVVVGYGTQRKKEVTNAVTSVKQEDFNKGNVNDVAQLLQGKVAGLTISRSGGDPNGNFAIRLRGLSTVGQNTQPLIVVDGVPGQDLNSVDPNDIASMDILKDGSAAAIYGTRGSAGVILITTKRGRSGKTQVEYNGYISSETVDRTIPLMNAEEFRATINKLGSNNDFGASTDWMDEITRNAFSHVHNLAMSGGSDKTTYRASVNYRDVQGIAINTGFQQLNARLNVEQRAIDDRLKLSLMAGQTTRNSDLGWNRAFREAANYNPTAPVKSPDAQYEQYGGYFQNTAVNEHYNPVAMLLQNKNNTKMNRLNLNVQAEFELIKNLKLLVRYGYQREDSVNNIYVSKLAYIDTRMINLYPINYTGNSSNGIAAQRNGRSNNNLFEGTASYDFSVVDKMNINLLAGYSYQDFNKNGSSIAGGNFISDDLSSDNIGSGLDFSRGLGNVVSYRNSSKLIAFFGRANINFDDTYFLSASIRREGSSKFGINNRWGNFPSVSAGVDINRLANIPSVNNLKLRASYGVTGAEPSDPYLSLATVTPSGVFLVNGEFVPAYGPGRNANPDLKWETKREFNIGLDFSIIDNKLYGSLDYYRRKTTDLLYYATVPQPPNFARNTWINVGDLRSNGFEAAISYNAISKGEFRWTTSANYSTFNVKLVSLSNETFAASTQQLANVGAPGLNGFYAVRLKENEDIGNLTGPIFAGVDASGKYTFVDLDKSGNFEQADSDYGIIGNGLPDFTIGWNNTFTYKNFDLNFFLRGVFGHDLLNSMRAFYEYPEVARRFNVVKTKYYNPELSVDQTYSYSSLDIEKADFVKLDNATLGYTINLANKSKAFRMIRLYLSGQNLFTITGYTGVDPEPRFTDTEQTGFGAVVSPGIERRDSWVRTRTVTFGVNVGF